jgi:hypothetical protein
MRRPRPAKTPVNLARKQTWQSRFVHYRHPPNIDEISQFLRQFGSDRKDVAARLLDSVEVVTSAAIAEAFRTLMKSVPNWHREKSKRQGKWRFVPYSFSAGESGDQMVAMFRQAMGMNTRHFNGLFVHPRELPSEGLRGEDTVILLDDFSGSGDQAKRSWNDLFKELVGGAGTVYLMVVAATTAAKDFIRDNTDLEVLAHIHLTQEDNFFADECQHFTADEKRAILDLCNKHFPDKPKGYGDCGLLFVMHHACPNNSVPLLHRFDKSRWTPLFGR